jgi:hypothetical protein
MPVPIRQATTPTIEPVEMSIPPVFMISVWPTARIRNTAAARMMVIWFCGVLKVSPVMNEMTA